MKTTEQTNAATAARPLTIRERLPFRFKYDPRFTAPLFITSILLAAHISFGILESYQQTLLAIGTAIAAEIVFSRLYWKKWPHPASAYISGISVGILIRSPFYWPFALTSLLSISSKYVLRYKDRHLWNPSNFGIVAMLLLAPEAVAPLSIQWGNNVWSMLVIWILGSIIIWRLRRFHICATYVVSFLAFAWLRTHFTGDNFFAEVAPLTGPMYQLFVFFMITDPKTTVHSRSGQAATAFVVALVESVLRLFELIHAPFYALFLVGPIAQLIEMQWNKKKEKSASIAVSA
ncbi:MAG TPA: RnfABCDGE type electron transport complex subunit D [Rhodothermales bacterium]|nr:RnfABCDGE type electron transport complex subunit D [Rhodothermales bacterium]